MYVALTAGSRIPTLELNKLCNHTRAVRYYSHQGHPCIIKGKVVESFAGVLAQRPTLVHLNLGDNEIRAEGAGRIAGVLGSAQR